MRRPLVLLMLPLLMLPLLLFAGCATMESVAPGRGLKADISNFTYDQIWTAALRVANEHFEVHESNKATGVIKAERTIQVFSWGEWVGIFVSPSTPGAPSYRLEVVNRKKAIGQISGQGWEHKVIRDVLYSLHNPGAPLP